MTENPEKAKLIFVAVKQLVMRGSERVAIAASVNMARRIANALNEYEPNEKGV